MTATIPAPDPALTTADADADGAAALARRLRHLLDQVASGDVAVPTPQERRLLHRVEAALAAFEAYGASRS